MSPPLPIYELDAAQTGLGGNLALAKSRGYFLYLVKNSNGEVVRQAEIATTDAGGARFVSVGVNAMMATLGQALGVLPTLEKVRAGSYEARGLTFGTGLAGGVQAIWLKADKGGEDLVYTVARVPTIYPGEVNHPPPAVIEDGRLYTADEFLAVWRPYVRDRLSLPAHSLVWTSDDQMHTYFLDRFIVAPGQGFSRMPTPSLAFGDSMTLQPSKATPAAGQKTTAVPASYHIDRMELVGVAFHIPPILYFQPNHKPVSSLFTARPTDAANGQSASNSVKLDGGENKARPAAPGTTRPLNASEQKLLGTLLADQTNIAVGTDNGQRLVLGAIRADRSCVECHDGAKVGDLLGALAYHLTPADAPADTVAGAAAVSASSP